VHRGAPARAVIVDHWPLLRLGLSRVLAGQDVRVVGESDDAGEGVRLAEEQRAQLLILGELRELRGLTAVEAIRLAKAAGAAGATRGADAAGAARAGGRLRILVIVGNVTPDELSELLAAGADGLMGRMAGPADVAGAIDQLLAGKRFVAPALLPALLGRVGPSQPEANGSRPEASLTDKEREVLACLATGGTNIEIARTLYITPATVKTHVAHIYAKLGVRNRNAAVSRALELGLLT